MNKLNQILFAVSSWMELEKSGAKRKGLQGGGEISNPEWQLIYLSHYLFFLGVLCE